MTTKLDFETLAKDVLAVLHKYDLTPDAFGVSLTIPRKEFESIAAEHPGHHPEMILISRGDGVQWYVQITWRKMPEDFPPGVILTPPPYE